MSAVFGNFDTVSTSDVFVTEHAGDKEHGVSVHIDGLGVLDVICLEFHAADGSWREMKRYEGRGIPNGPLNEFVDTPNGTKIRLRLDGPPKEGFYYQLTDIVEGYRL